jgi:hypothetical protein
MAKFMYLYRGPDPGPSDERMPLFQAWIEKTGDALLDVGSPFGARAAVHDDGTEGAAADDLIGYTVVEAADLAEAKALTAGLPLLLGGHGTHRVEVFELLPI